MNSTDKVSWRVQAPVYGTGFFTGNLFPMSHVVIPAWAAIELEASLGMIGIIVASRQLLPITMSIHGGALLDRFGPRSVITILGVIGALSTAAVPLFPFIWATILLQVVIGFCETTNWIGVQSCVGTLMKGKALYAGRMTAAARIGGAIGPILVGLVSTKIGVAEGFFFFGAWAFCGAVGALFIPQQGKFKDGVKDNGTGTSLLPKVSDYKESLRLLLLPAIALVVATTFVRQAGSGVQASFFGVWLIQELAFERATIGYLIGVANAVSALSALSVGRLTQSVRDYWLLLITVGLAIVGIALTPLFEGFAVLAVAISVRGVGQGLNLPLMIAIASRSVPFDLQGRVAALRISFNRLGSAVLPMIMGGFAEFVGLENAFYLIGAGGVFLLLLIACWVFIAKDRFQ